MASSNIKLFDENKGNMLNDTEFNISTQRLNGLQTGVASSQLQNKAMYQASLMAYAIAQLMLANGKNANDTDAVSTFVNNLLASIVQKVADKASAADVANKTAGKWIDAKLLGESIENVADDYLPLLGGSMLGDLILNRDPVSSLQAATKQYVDTTSAKIVFGNYIGDGAVPKQANPKTLTFNFKPFLLILSEKNQRSVRSEFADPCIMFRDSVSAHFGSNAGSSNENLGIVWGDNSVSWFLISGTKDYNALNHLDLEYSYTCVGV